MIEIDEIKQQLRDVNVVSFSGGKDSTAVLQLVLSAIENTGKKLYILTADTFMEIPFYQSYVLDIKHRLNDYIRNKGLNAEIITVYPSYDRTFWVRTLGYGYPMPHMTFRWCTGAVKVDPIMSAVKNMPGAMTFVGVRQVESKERASRYKVKNYQLNHFAPILYWSNSDVWEYLLTEPCPWGENHRELVQVYRYASDECVYGLKQNVCIGNARYGCWICPLQKSIQLDLIAYHTKDDRYLDLKKYKDAYIGYSTHYKYRSNIRRNMENGAGPFLVETRRELFEKLKELERQTGWQLITPAEEQQIFDLWVSEKDLHNIPCDLVGQLF
ncbi:MAG: phosphoadenosine phosphosulfate reductase family protein [Nitrospirae bacterium]|nr:phosphoadenosine phosphosulfate reductase family protein [Nitrospirota bacterium]